MVVLGLVSLQSRTITKPMHSQAMVSASGGFRGGSRGSLEPPSWPKLFHFHEEFQEILCKFMQANPPFLHLNPLFRNPGSAPVSNLDIEQSNETILQIYLTNNLMQNVWFIAKNNYTLYLRFIQQHYFIYDIYSRMYLLFQRS